MEAIKIGSGKAWIESLLVMGLEVLFIGFKDASNLHKIAHLDAPAANGLIT